MPRPRYHYAAASNWLSDPNGLVHHAGEWHMFYQYNPQGEEWGHMAWGHAVSPDLLHWHELPPALEEADGVMIFSGSAVIDRDDTAGFGKDAMVAVYTGADRPAKRQFQCLASSTDNGRHWSKFAGNPVLDAGLADFRDPNVFWHAPTRQWIMTVVRSAENRAALYSSADLRNWRHLSFIPTQDAPGQLWECPLLIELPVEGTSARHWLFKVDVLSGAPGSGALYLTGTFDGTAFTADGPWQVADMGSDFYAAIAWHEPRDTAGRPCWIGWMGNHAWQRFLPRQGWRGAMSLPRRLSLVRAGARYCLRQEIEPAFIAAAGTPAPLALDLTTRDIAAASRLAIDGRHKSWVVELGSADGRHLLLTREGDRLRVARHDPVTPQLDIEKEAVLPPGTPLDIWLDCGSIEILGQRGKVSLTLQHRMDGATYSIRADRHLRATHAALTAASAAG